MNTINASPLLFHEEYDHFHCILRGSKRFVLVNTLKYPDVRKVRREKMEDRLLIFFDRLSCQKDESNGDRR